MTKIIKKYNSSRSHKKNIVLAILLVALIYIGLAAAFRIWPFEKHVTITAASVKDSLPSRKSAGAKSQTNGTNAGSDNRAVDNNPKTPSSQTNSDSKNLAAPSGTFVNLYDANADTQMNSICNTTSGASCQITFTHGSLTIALPVKTADSSGTTSWAWTPRQIGLTNASWHVVAKATLGSQTKTTDNGSLELVIHD